MRPAEFAPEAIIHAGQELLAAGRNITGFALRQKVGGGNPARLKQVWEEHLASTSVAQAVPAVELPVEVAEEVATVTAALADRITKLATELNDKAVKAAERRVAEVVRTAGEQTAQAERELADASQTVDDLESTLDATKAEAEALSAKLSGAQVANQAQAVELAQLKERLAASDAAAKSASDQHQAELARLNEAAIRLREEHASARRTDAAALEQLREELTNSKARADAEQVRRDAADEARRQAEAALAATGIDLARAVQHASDLEGELSRNREASDVVLREQKQRSVEVIGRLEESKVRLEADNRELNAAAKDAAAQVGRLTGELDALRTAMAQFMPEHSGTKKGK